MGWEQKLSLAEVCFGHHIHSQLVPGRKSNDCQEYAWHCDMALQVTKIAEMGAYVRLLEYGGVEGMILLSELSRRRIRSINKLIKVWGLRGHGAIARMYVVAGV
jgi:hypothetical protein